MDEHMHQDLPMSRNLLGKVDNIVFDIHRKRKYEEQFDHPFPTHKFRFRASGSGVTSKINNSELFERTKISFKLKPTQSGEGSNSFMGTYDRTVSLDSVNPEQTHFEFQKPHFGGETASGDSSGSVNNFRHNLFSLDSNSINCVNDKKRKESKEATEEDEVCCKSQSFRHPNTCLEMSYAAYGDFICTEYGIDMEHISDIVADELLYSNDVETAMIIPPPGGWIPSRECAETRNNTRKPTIDQEFEEYFANLII